MWSKSTKNYFIYIVVGCGLVVYRLFLWRFCKVRRENRFGFIEHHHNEGWVLNYGSLHSICMLAEKRIQQTHTLHTSSRIFNCKIAHNLFIIQQVLCVYVTHIWPFLVGFHTNTISIAKASSLLAHSALALWIFN